MGVQGPFTEGQTNGTLQRAEKPSAAAGCCTQSKAFIPWAGYASEKPTPTKVFCSEGCLPVWHWEKDGDPRTLNSGIKRYMCAFLLLSAVQREQGLKEKLGRWYLCCWPYPWRGPVWLAFLQAPRGEMTGKWKTGAEKDSRILRSVLPFFFYLRKRTKWTKTQVKPKYCILHSMGKFHPNHHVKWAPGCTHEIPGFREASTEESECQDHSNTKYPL